MGLLHDLLWVFKFEHHALVFRLSDVTVVLLHRNLLGEGLQLLDLVFQHFLFVAFVLDLVTAEL